jgi:hypothetical protein
MHSLLANNQRLPTFCVKFWVFCSFHWIRLIMCYKDIAGMIVFAPHTVNSVITSSIWKENTKLTFQEAFVNKYFSWKWLQLTTERLLLADPAVGRISTACNRAVGALCYHNLTQHHNICSIEICWCGMEISISNSFRDIIYLYIDIKWDSYLSLGTNWSWERG